jgi:hypothetical protein
MKTTKIILVAILLSFALAGFSQFISLTSKSEQGPQPENFSILISLKTAIHNPGLVRAMFGQLTPGLITNEQPLYTFTVRYNRVVYQIVGTYEEWQNFFRMDLEMGHGKE